MIGRSMTQKNNPATAVEQPKSGKRSTLRQYAPLLIIVSLMGLVFAMGWHEHFTIKQLALNLERLKTFINSHFLVSLAAYIILYMLITALSIPAGAVVTVAGGLLFGWFTGTLATVIGATIGATAIFLAAKSSFGALLREKAGPWLKKLEEGFRENALSYMFFLRLVPAFPFWLVNLAPAFLGVKLSHYMLATFFGIIPGTLAFSYIGEGLESVIVAQRSAYEACLEKASSASECEFGLDVSALATPELITALLLLSLVALIPVVIKRLRRRKDQA